MKKKDLPSKAQAKFLAHCWGAAQTCKVGGYTEATILVCVKRGWLIPNGETGEYPNGQAWTGHVVSNVGLSALESYLMQQRFDNADAARA